MSKIEKIENVLKSLKDLEYFYGVTEDENREIHEYIRRLECLQSKWELDEIAKEFHFELIQKMEEYQNVKYLQLSQIASVMKISIVKATKMTRICVNRGYIEEIEPKYFRIL